MHCDLTFLLVRMVLLFLLQVVLVSLISLAAVLLESSAIQELLATVIAIFFVDFLSVVDNAGSAANFFFLLTTKDEEDPWL